MPRIDELFRDWVDFDIAEYYLACLIGIAKYDETFAEFRRIKEKFWTKNDLGDMLYSTLEKLTDIEILEKDGDSRYRWNSKFEAYWLNPDIAANNS